ASTEARTWILNRLVQLIDATRPDYLKWDNNFWLNCNRDGHGHGPDEGGFSHVEGLYSILNDLRHRYPNLLIENTSGGGNRLDYGLGADGDTAWMDDRTGPSVVERHNIEGLIAAFPPAYLLSFLVNSPDEPMDDADADVAHQVRSRMPGVLGMSN